MGTVLLDVDAGVARITLNRPEALNTYTTEMVLRLREVVDAVGGDPAVRAVLIRGAGPGFCGGADLKSLLPHLGPDGVGEEGRQAVRRLHECVVAVHALPKPVIAAVHGACAGGGIGLALAADLLWAAESAHFTAAFSAIALTPDTGTSYLMVRAIGERKTREMLFTNRRVKAAEAAAIGLADRVLPDDELLPAAEKMAAKLARGPTAALARTKALLDASRRRSFPEQLEAEVANALACLASADLAEGVRAFVEKRPPRFGGETPE